MTVENDIADFDYTAFAVRFPEFSEMPMPRIRAFWTEANIYIKNDGTSIIEDVPQRGVILNLMAAHIAALNAAVVPGQIASAGGLVGRISGATEGSVSVTLEPMGSGTSAMAAWLNQTRYGAQLWAMLQRFLTARFYTGRQPYLGIGPRSVLGTGW